MSLEQNSCPSPRLLLLVCGLSGAGHSSAHHQLSDLGFFAVDNLPLALVGNLVHFVQQSTEKKYEKMSLLLQIDSHERVEAYTKRLQSLRSSPHFNCILLFLEADPAILLKRYSETRRPHPRFDPALDQTLSDTLERERLLMNPLRAAADHIIDTSELTIHQFRREIRRFVSTIAADTKPNIRVNFLSFGFKYGAPRDCDLLIDVRFLQNPYFVEHLRPKIGLESDVADFVLQTPEAQEFLQRYSELLHFLIPRYAFEGKAYLNVGVGCTGGRHRSVAIAEALGKRMGLPDIFVSVTHRDVEK